MSCCLCQRLRVGLEHRIEELAYHALGRVEPAVKKDGAKDRFHRIGEDRRAAKATAFHLPFAQAVKSESAAARRCRPLTAA
jgi:hypothetical protein